MITSLQNQYTKNELYILVAFPSGALFQNYPKTSELRARAPACKSSYNTGDSYKCYILSPPLINATFSLVN